MNASPFLPRRLFLSSLGALVLVPTLPSLALASDLVVIVHSKVTDTPSKTDLGPIFTTRKSEWSGGVPMVPLNLPAKHDVRIAFDSKILGMDADQVARYWIDRRIRGGSAPPKQIPNEDTIVKLVEKTEGAIAYVSRAAIRDARVRILFPV